MSITILRRTAAALLLAALAPLAFAAPATAHTELLSSNPPEGAALDTAPRQLQLTFGEAVRLPADPVHVTGSDGTTWVTGPAMIAGAVVTVPVQPTGPAGPYTITWKVTADDGDAISGAIHFTLTTAATPPTTTTTTTTTTAPAATSQAPVPAPQADTTSNGGFPTWGWVVIAIVAAAALASLLLLRSRRGGSASNP